MTKMTNSFIAALALSGALALSPPLLAQGRSHDGPGLFGSSFQTARLARKLHLSEEQREQFRAILNASRSEADDLADAMLANRHALRELQKGTEMSESEIQEIADLRGQLVSRMIVLKARIRSQINALLTPDQREKFQEMQKRRKQRQHDRRFKPS